MQGSWGYFAMKFRLVWVGSDDGGVGRPRLREDNAALADSAPRSGYEQRNSIMLRRERLQNGRLRYTSVLQESGLLASFDRGRQMVQVRRTIEGGAR
jgi:hypothetical protein